MVHENEASAEIADAVRLVGEATQLAQAFVKDVRETLRGKGVLGADQLLRLTQQWRELLRAEHDALDAADAVVKKYGHRAAADGLLRKIVDLEQLCLRAHRAIGPYVARALVISAGEHPQEFSALVLETPAHGRPVPAQGPAAE